MRTTRNKIILDRVIGKPLACLLNCVAWPVGKILGRNHDDSPQTVKTIAIAKLLGLGSILRVIPMIKALKQKYPQAQYIFITTYRNKELTERLELFDSILYINDDHIGSLFFDVLKLIFKLWQYKIDLYFDLEIYSAFSTILALLSLARNRYGFYKDNTLFRIGLNTHLVFFNNSQHITKIYLQLAKSCGINDREYKIGHIKLREADKEESNKYCFSKFRVDSRRYIVINPNASDLLLERRWPAEYFVLLINAVAVSWKGVIYIVGNSDERLYVSELYNLLSAEAKKITFNTAGAISFGAVMALISGGDLMITNDSGLYHVAVSFGVPVISFWGPGDPNHYADIGQKNNVIFYHEGIYCSPCLYKTDFPPCRGNNICLKAIDPKKVYEKACYLLGTDTSADTKEMERVYNKEFNPGLDITVRVPKKKNKYAGNIA